MRSEGLLFLIGAGPLSSTTGWLEWNLFLSRYVPVGQTFAFQAAYLDPSGAISLSIPTPFAVAWAFGRQL